MANIYGNHRCACNKLRDYETFIWDYRVSIANYLKARSNREFEEAKIQAERVADL